MFTHLFMQTGRQLVIETKDSPICIQNQPII